MFVNKGFFEQDQQQQNQTNEGKKEIQSTQAISPRPPSGQNTKINQNSARQKLAERRKLIAAQSKSRKNASKRTKTKIIKKNIDLQLPNNNLSVFNNEISTTPKIKRPPPIQNIQINNNRSNSIMFGLSDHDNNNNDNNNINNNNNNLLSSPSSIQSKDDSIQNIQIIDNYNHRPQSQSTPKMINEQKINNVDNKIINDVNEDIHEFIKNPVPKNKIIQTYIIRNKSGISNRLYPSYCVYLKDTKNFLMFAKKRQKNRTSNYIITSDAKHTNKTHESYLGKVRANFVGTEFIIYDNGRSPKEVENNNKIRSELCSILYETNILGTKGPRKMTILLPKLSTISTDKWRQTDIKSSSSMLMSTYKQNLTKSLTILQNKSPKWNEHIGAYVLNFNGRVTMASVKNFQLVNITKNNDNNNNNNNDDDDVILQFGRVGKDRFTMDIKYPLTPLQAFGICLTSFDNKLACE